MWKHKLLEHPDEDVTFSMKVLKKHYSAFERMVTATSSTQSLATTGAAFPG